MNHLRNMIPPLQDYELELLIGYDCPSAMAPLEVITGSETEPFALRTTLGWSIIGSANPHLDRQGNQSFIHRTAVKIIPVPSVTDVLRVLELDFNERSYDCKCVSQVDVKFIRFLSDNIRQKEDGHYEMPLPFKGTGSPFLPNNKRLATVQLKQPKGRLKASKQYYDHYTDFIREIINRGDAESAPLASERETVWYISHHGKPGKLRIIFDCSKRFNGTSLNDTLLTNPDLINALVGVLIRFRKIAVAMICDIERMFHQFYVSLECHKYLRFLWWEGGQIEAGFGAASYLDVPNLDSGIWHSNTRITTPQHQPS